MRILFVLEHFYPYIGGVEQLFWQLSKSLVARGHEVKVITTRFDKKLSKTQGVLPVEYLAVANGNPRLPMLPL